jgi:uncharacterized protein (DUF362 family)/Pyruvate/2-oxoacid:ferredoxin oxidoreductase delta subunit
MTTVVLERCESYSPEVAGRAVERALSAAVGPERSGLAGQTVLLKPNLLAARDPARAITTHPVIVGAAIDYFQGLGARVSVGDSPAGAVRGVRRVWENTGMLEICRCKGAEIVNLEAGGWVSKSVSDRTYEIARSVYDFDRIVNMPKLKTHILTLMTASIKNMFGCVPGFRKSVLHVAHPDPGSMSRALVDIFSLVKPWITLVDAVDVMEGNGPSSGRVRHLGLLAAGDDCVALDAVLAEIIGLNPARVPTTWEAARRGLGEVQGDRIEVKGPEIGSLAVKDFDVPANWKFFLIPGFLGRLLARYVWVRPVVRREVCTGCGECVAICAAGAINLSSGRAGVDDRMCTSCMCCHEACSVGAIDTRMSWLARRIA